MPKEEWGVKRLCPTSGRRFYDMNRTPVVSPYTGEVVTFDANAKARVAVAEKVAPKEVEEEVDLMDDDEDIILDDDDDSDIDDSLLEDDDDEDTVSLDEIADVASDDDDN